MALANDMTALLNKISRRAGLLPLEPHLPDYLNKEAWANVIKEDTLPVFSRSFPFKFKLIVDDTTCDKKIENHTMWYYIKDEILGENTKLLGVKDIDWMDTSADNNSLTNGSMGQYYYGATSFPCPEATLDSVLALQMSADFASLYNNGIVIDFEYPNRFALRGIGNVNYDLSQFVVVLLVEHKNLSTISPTMMNVFEDLAMADVCNFLYMNLRYYDNLETVYVNLDLKLSELQEFANKRTEIVEKLEEARTSASNWQSPILWSI